MQSHKKREQLKILFNNNGNTKNNQNQQQQLFWFYLFYIDLYKINHTISKNVMGYSLLSIYRFFKNYYSNFFLRLSKLCSNLNTINIIKLIKIFIEELIVMILWWIILFIIILWIIFIFKDPYMNYIIFSNPYIYFTIIIPMVVMYLYLWKSINYIINTRFVFNSTDERINYNVSQHIKKLKNLHLFKNIWYKKWVKLLIYFPIVFYGVFILGQKLWVTDYTLYEIFNAIVFWFILYFSNWFTFLFFLFNTIYIFLYDNIWVFFSEKLQERNFYLNLYKKSLKIDKSLNLLNSNMLELKNWILSEKLWKGLSWSVLKIGNLYNHLNRSTYLDDKDKFIEFLYDLINESIEDYLIIFNKIDRLISKHKKNKNNILKDLSDIEVDIYRKQLEAIKEKMYNMKINQ